MTMTLRGAPDQPAVRKMLKRLDEVRCANEISSITLKNANMLATPYKLDVLMPSKQCIAHLPPRGYVMVSKSFLKFGVRFSLH